MVDLRIVLLLLSVFLSCGQGCQQGRIVYYAPSWDWQRIAANHNLSIPPGLTPISRPDCTTLGSTGWMSLAGRRPLRWIQVDCTAPQDQELVRRRNIVAEVPWSVAERVPGMLSDGWTTGRLWLDPPRSPPRRWSLRAPALPR